MTESGSPSDSVRCGAALVGLFILVATITAFAPGYAAQPITLKVEATHGLPGLHHSALSRFLATHMAEVGLADWRFVPAAGDASAPDRVEWTIRLNPYAGGEVRNFVRTLFSEQRLGVHRPVTRTQVPTSVGTRGPLAPAHAGRPAVPEARLDARPHRGTGSSRCRCPQSSRAALTVTVVDCGNSSR
jgi:hypothetical protein